MDEIPALLEEALNKMRKQRDYMPSEALSQAIIELQVTIMWYDKYRYKVNA